ncbi:Rv3235 family protein [Streptosporangium longisporum]|uniref:Rv3235 family protein n=1 Tax=Streptosporangium longisporum TaxID=46187 RepID=UPI0031E8E7BD
MSSPRRLPTLPRLAPSPAAEPPYDDDRHGGDGSAAPPYVQGTLALALGPVAQEPPPPVARIGGARRGPAPEAPDPAPTRPPGPPRPVATRTPASPATRTPNPAGTRSPGAPPDDRWLWTLVQAVAEILAGRRPPASVSAHLTARTQAELARKGGTMRCTRLPRAGRTHVSRPETGVVEMCAVVDCGDRSRVLALRLERRGVRWLCVEVETTP